MAGTSGNPFTTTELSGRERALRNLIALYAVIYFAFGTALLVYPKGVVKLMNHLTGWLGLEPQIEIPSHPYWATVTVSLLLLLAVMCFMAAGDIRGKRQLVWLMVFAKYASSAAQIAYLALSRDHPPGFGLGALVDGFLGTLALVFLLLSRTAPGLKAESRPEEPRRRSQCCDWCDSICLP